MRQDEIQEFYLNQDDIGKTYTRPVSAQDNDRAEIITNYLPASPIAILELGAGGGQRAFATAKMGNHVTALEFVPKLAAHCVELSSKLPTGSLKVIQGDFYKVEIQQKYDAIVYWDGFGVGDDEEQRCLLKRIKGWLKQDGIALIDIYTPWHAIRQIGVEMNFEHAKRRYDFDAENCRWLDTWWDSTNPDKKYTQSLRCYSPADFKMLLKDIGLEISEIIHGGYYDQNEKKYYEVAPTLEKSIWYTVKLHHNY
ncbi:class I SAM-dependent methyltransferase [Candidatus Riflebacteria bacterium]